MLCHSHSCGGACAPPMTPEQPGPSSLRHKIAARLMVRGGIVTSFAWRQTSGLAPAPVATAVCGRNLLSPRRRRQDGLGQPRSSASVSRRAGSRLPPLRRIVCNGGTGSRRPVVATCRYARAAHTHRYLHGGSVSVFCDRRPGRDEAGAADRGGRSVDRRRAGVRRPRHRQVHGGPRAGRAAAADEGRGRLPYGCDPAAPAKLCEICRSRQRQAR